MKSQVSFVAALVLSSAFLFAQTGIQVYPAELSMPFGAASGKLVTVGETLAFIDDQQPAASFALSRGEIQTLTGEDGIITVQSTRSVRDRSGERNQVSFRVSGSGTINSVLEWYNAAPETRTVATADRVTGDDLSFSARHKHRLGSCRGKLMITADRLVYESIDNLTDSRRWDFKEIKELKRDNPYELKVVPFAGSDYNFELPGSGMDSSDYRLIVDRVTAARAGANR